MAETTLQEALTDYRNKMAHAYGQLLITNDITKNYLSAEAKLHLKNSRESCICLIEEIDKQLTLKK